MNYENVPISEKFTLTIKEASAYSNIGVKAMRRLAADHTDSFAFWQGNRLLIIRCKFEEYLLSRLANRKEVKKT